MSVNEMDSWYLKQEEPLKSCLLALRSIILNWDPAITAMWSYGMPTFCYKGRRVCYLWVHKKLKQPYIGMIDGNKMDHPQLIQEKRSRMKILLVDMEKDIPIDLIDKLLKQAISLFPA
jgi:hypothetical protein